MGIKISELTAATSIDSADLIPIVQGSYTKKLSFTNLMGTIVATANIFTAAQGINLSSAAALFVGPNGNTNPTLRVITNASSGATGLSITNGAAGSGVTLGVLSSGTDESVTVIPKGSGILYVGASGDRRDIFAAGFSSHNSAWRIVNSGGACAITTGGLQVASIGDGSGTSRIQVRSDGCLGFHSDAVWTGTLDTGLGRNAAGVVEVNTGSAGSYGALRIGAPTSSTVAQIIKGAASQSANLTEWQNSSGTVLASVRVTGTSSQCVGLYFNQTDNDSFKVLTVKSYGGNDFDVIRHISGQNRIDSYIEWSFLGGSPSDGYERLRFGGNPDGAGRIKTSLYAGGGLGAASHVTLEGGTPVNAWGAVHAGNLILTGGTGQASNGNGGSVYVVGGAKDGSGVAGNVYLGNTGSTIRGTVYLDATAIFNEAGSDLDYRIEGDTDANLLFTDASTDRIGVGTNTPLAKQHVVVASGNEVLRLESTATNDDPNYRIFQNRVATTDNTVTTLHTITLSDDSIYLIEAKVIARRTGGTAGTTGDCASYVIRASYKRSAAGAATIVGSISNDFTAEDNAALDCTFDTSTNDVRVRVTGDTDNNYTWHGTIIIQNMSS